MRNPAVTLAMLGVGCAVIAAQSAPTIHITGRVVAAATGQPIAGARIGSSVADVGLSAVTDAQGDYQLRTLGGGRFAVRASAPGYVTAVYGDDPGLGPLIISTTAERGASGGNFALQKGAIIAGRAIDDAKEPIVKARVTAVAERWFFGEKQLISVAFAETDDRGDFRLSDLAPGDYAVSVQDRAIVTFAPSTTSLKAARRITVGIGQHVENITIQTRAGASGTITGQLAGGERISINRRVYLRSESVDTVTTDVRADLQNDGRYRFENIAPGRYWLIVRPDPSPAQSRTWLRQSVVLGAGAELNQDLTLSEGATITTKWVGNRPGRDLSLTPIDGLRNPEAGMARSSGGAIRITGLAPGRYRWQRTQEATFQLSIFEGPSSPDIADLVLTVRPGDAPREVEVDVTGGGKINGTITDRDDKPTTVGGVLIAATDSRYWTGVSRRLLIARADQSGFYEAARLPGGEYFVVYLSQLAPGQLWDAAFLKKATGSAKRVNLAVGAAETVNVQMR